MTRAGWTNDGTLLPVWSLISILVVLTFFSHGVAMANADIRIAHGMSTSNLITDEARPDSTERSCDVDHIDRLAPSPGRYDVLMITRACERHLAPPADAWFAGVSVAPTPSPSLLRVLLQVFLN